MREREEERQLHFASYIEHDSHTWHVDGDAEYSAFHKNYDKLQEFLMCGSWLMHRNGDENSTPEQCE